MIDTFPSGAVSLTLNVAHEETLDLLKCHVVISVVLFTDNTRFLIMTEVVVKALKHKRKMIFYPQISSVFTTANSKIGKTQLKKINRPFRLNPTKFIIVRQETF